MKSHNVGKNRKIHQKQRYAAEFPDQHFPVGKKKKPVCARVNLNKSAVPFRII